ncbi:hypothetical protein OJF2_72640 [Aquisphaera giovannonii]|uniref:Phage portal protein, SPP1 Gp6-like n=1 Tax=Aquisphaera giovannonii TaxID=406548 RepID=A0A5B9WDB2_9BACT|nr:hypothetical protein [Aquisphaera giovannonii]QEH38658.1 hypothetical protein OJF2_72640 [Aquisphaera giovannonii]
MALAPNSAILACMNGPAGMPRLKLPDGRIVDRPHPEWLMHQLRWRWLLDSWEGGEAYRMAVYGFDPQGMPIRNLIRHKREYPSSFEAAAPQAGRPPGTDQAAQATDDDYELRRARTPVPTFVAEAAEAHLARIYGREVHREGPERLVAWWRNVDGRGGTIDDWMAGTIAPLLLVLGQLDIIVDHPAVPDGEEVRSRADEVRLGLDSCVASYILPENLVWWSLDRLGGYAECLVREVADGGEVRWRFWDARSWAIYGESGELVRGPTPHPYGRVPIIRVFDRRRPRSRNIGLPRYESIAEIQREFYNRDSELILSDTTQAHPLLQGPEDYVQADGTVPIGPNWLLPKKKNTGGSGATYEGFDVVPFPKEGAESIRLNKADLRDAADRAALLMKPAGGAGTSGSTVGQSGISKRLDQAAGNDLLGKIASMLGRAERQVAELALLVLDDGRPRGDAAAVRVNYPTQFDLFTAEELARAIAQFQGIVADAGNAPATESELLRKLVRLMLPGLEDADYAGFDAEIAAYLEARASDGPAEEAADGANPGPAPSRPRVGAGPRREA